jgi:ChrR-like protein with cupin domain
MPNIGKIDLVTVGSKGIDGEMQLEDKPLALVDLRSIALKLQQTKQELPQVSTRRDFLSLGVGLSLILGSAVACGRGLAASKEGHDFFNPEDLPWHPAPGHGPGVWERIVSGGQDAGVTTRFLRFDPGSGRDEVVTHDFWEEIIIISGTFESGGRAYPAGYVAVRPPGTPHGPFHSTSGCLNFEVRYRLS